MILIMLSRKGSAPKTCRLLSENRRKLAHTSLIIRDKAGPSVLRRPGRVSNLGDGVIAASCSGAACVLHKCRRRPGGCHVTAIPVSRSISRMAIMIAWRTESRHEAWRPLVARPRSIAKASTLVHRRTPNSSVLKLRLETTCGSRRSGRLRAAAQGTLTRLTTIPSSAQRTHIDGTTTRQE